MPDILALVATAVETVKKLRAVAEKLKDAETRNLIGDLSLSLADLKIEIADLKQENHRLQSELEQAKKTEEQGNQMVVEDGVLFFAVAPPGKALGPYCPNCMENDGRWSLMKDNRGTQFEAICKFRCSACKGHF